MSRNGFAPIIVVGVIALTVLIGGFWLFYSRQASFEQRSSGISPVACACWDAVHKTCLPQSACE